MSDGSTMGQKFRALAEMRAYWEGLRGQSGGLVPRRSDVDPRGLARSLDQVFIAERIGCGLASLRISGMGMADLAGMDMKGLPLSTLFVPEARLRLAAALEKVFAQPGIAELHLEAERGIGRPALEARLLLLPLLASDGRSTLALGCLAGQGEIGRAPRRFAIARVLEERLLAPQAEDPILEKPIQPAPAFAEPASVHSLARPIPGRSHLRLVHSAD